MTLSERAVALTVAGSDSSGAAGLQADLKTFHQLGVYGASAVTLVSAQHGAGVDALQPLSADLVCAQVQAVRNDFPVAARKSGALGSAAVVSAVAAVLREDPLVPLVVDPVLRTSSGRALLDREGLRAMRERLIPDADLVTPNLPEAALLLERPNLECSLAGEDERCRAAEALLALGAKAVLLKGGHAPGPECADLFFDGEEALWLRAPRRPSLHTRGTGCTYSAAITALLARGLPMKEAVAHAHRYVQRAIAGAPGALLVAGAPRGPLDHWADPS